MGIKPTYIGFTTRGNCHSATTTVQIRRLELRLQGPKPRALTLTRYPVVQRVTLHGALVALVHSLRRRDSNPHCRGYESLVLPLHHRASLSCVDRTGIEPVASCLQGRRTTISTYSPKKKPPASEDAEGRFRIHSASSGVKLRVEGFVHHVICFLSVGGTAQRMLESNQLRAGLESAALPVS